jgi:D-arabinose 1-dehydrogenase-like Zn-dependent alcohol dehydrogenase
MIGSKTSMRAVIQDGTGPPEILRVRSVPVPEQPGGDEVLIRLRAAGVCYHDLLVRDGTYRRLVQFPLVPGHEMAGDVLAVGENVTRIKVGDQVASTNRETCGHCDLCRSGQEGICPNQRFFGHNGPGAYAEFALVRENALSAVPRAIPPEAACVLSCAIGTELHAIREVGRVKAGETVLVTGAGGGLGIHGVQVAKLAGAFVVALTSTPGKAPAIRAAGADAVVTIARGERFDDKLRAVAPGGFDVICDNVGEPVFASCFRTLAIGGRYVFVGQLNDRSISYNPAWLLLRNTSLLGSNSSTRKELDDVVKLVDRGLIKPVLDRTMPLEEAPAAHRRVMTAEATGRVVLVMR